MMLLMPIAIAGVAVVSANLAFGDTAAQASRKAHRPPVRKHLPKISGVAVLGKTLHASPGRWKGAARFSYRWERCNARGKRCRAIHRAKPSRKPWRSYTLTSRDLGHTIRVIVVASNRWGRRTATSHHTAVVRRPSPPPTTPPTPTPTFSGLHVVGNHLANANGATVVLHGVDRSGTEYACTKATGSGGAFTDGPTGSAEFSPMPSWKINSVFIGLNEDCWLGINGANPQFSGQNYVNFIKSEVASAESYGLYPVIGYFWGGSGTALATGQPSMPDNDHTPLFWEEVASTFRNDPNVIFRLQEEPHPANNGNGLAVWQCWSQGDAQYSPSSDRTPPLAPTPSSTHSHCSEGFTTVGFQSLVNIVRGTGAMNVIQTPGVQYANMMACSTNVSPTACGFLDSAQGIELHDTLASPQLMGDVDVYPDGNICGSTSCYQSTYAPVIAQMPFEAGETGPNTSGDTNEDTFLNWMDSAGAGYYAWAWDTWSTLLSSYNGAPKSPWGTDYRTRLTR